MVPLTEWKSNANNGRDKQTNEFQSGFGIHSFLSKATFQASWGLSDAMSHGVLHA